MALKYQIFLSFGARDGILGIRIIVLPPTFIGCAFLWARGNNVLFIAIVGVVSVKF